MLRISDSNVMESPQTRSQSATNPSIAANVSDTEQDHCDEQHHPLRHQVP